VRHTPKAAVIARSWCVAATAIILLATLSPQVGSANLRQGFFAPLTPGAIGASLDLAQNVLLYMPLGLALGLVGISWMRATFAAAALSLSIELCQFFVPGRDPVATDIVVNTAGASIAWLISSTRAGRLAGSFLAWIEEWIARATCPSDSVAASLSLGWALSAAAVITATCWLLSINLPAPFYFLVSSPFLDVVSGPVRIGADGSPLGFFHGLIDDVRIYAGARDPETIKSDMQGAVSPSGADGDPVVAYSFDLETDDITRDATGRGHDALVRRAAWTPEGRFGGAFEFDGDGSELLIPGFPQLHLRRSMTIEAWVKPAGRQRGTGAIVSHTALTYFLRSSSGDGALSPSGGGRFGENPLAARLRGTLPANEWTHLAASYDGQTISLYVNGRPAVRRRHWSTHHPVGANIGAIELAPGLVRAPARLRDILSESFSLNVRIRCGALQSEPGPVFSIIGVESTEALVLEAAGAELRVRSASQSQRLGLAPVDHRIPGALSGCAPGQTVHFVLKGPLHSPQLEDRSGKPLAGVAPGIGSAWAFLFDSRLLPATAVSMLSCVFLGMLMVPFGFWARVRLLTVAGALALIAVVYLVPAAWSMPAIDRYQGGGLLAGVLAGMLLRSVPDKHRLNRLEHDKHVECN